jgi:hypothetical protein
VVDVGLRHVLFLHLFGAGAEGFGMTSEAVGHPIRGGCGVSTRTAKGFQAPYSSVASMIRHTDASGASMSTEAVGFTGSW